METREMSGPPKSDSRGRRAVSPRFSPVNLSGFYFPFKGVPLSICAHAAVLFLAHFFSTAHYPELHSGPLEPDPFDQWEAVEVMYLPRLTGGGAAGGGGGEASDSSAEEPAGGAISEPIGRAGMAHPGPQELFSDFEEPTSRTETLLRPDLQDLPVLNRPIDLPNVVVIPDLFAPPPAPAPEAPVEEPPVASQAASIDPEPPLPEQSVSVALSEAFRSDPVPFLPLPFADAELTPQFPQPAPTLAEAARPGIVEETEVEPSNESLSMDGSETEAPAVLEPPRLERRESDLPSMVALSPMPSPDRLPGELPVGEVRGRFAISPQADSSAAETDPGLGASEEVDFPGSGDAVSLPGAAAGAGSGRYPTVVNLDFGSGRGGAGRGTGLGSGSGAGEGAGTGSGSGAGVGTGRGSGRGEGIGAGAGSAPLAGITIIGGASGGGARGDGARRGSPQGPVVLPPSTPSVKSSYGIFALSTETSGGGLPTFGVFENQQVYTVYLDMKEGESDSDSAPLWILEYAVPAATAHTALRDTEDSEKGLVLPFPIVRIPPELSPELVAEHLRKLVIIYGRITEAGDLEETSIKQSPNPDLNAPVLESLSWWKFRPAQLDGKPVPAWILMGIPLWLPQSNR